jgi:hypothetical protein
MNREKVRKRSREVPSPLLSVLIFASLGVVAVPVPPAHLHPQAIASKYSQINHELDFAISGVVTPTKCFPRARREAQPRLLFYGEVRGSSFNSNQADADQGLVIDDQQARAARGKLSPVWWPCT